MEERGLRERSRGEQLSDAISGLASTPAFAMAHVVFFAGWLVSQSGMVSVVPIYDPFPFTFLTLVVSLEAIFLSIFVLISQRRMTRQADLFSHLDLQVNLLTEQEATKALKVLYSIAEHLEVPDPPSDKPLDSARHRGCNRSGRQNSRTSICGRPPGRSQPPNGVGPECLGATLLTKATDNE